MITILIIYCNVSTNYDVDVYNINRHLYYKHTHICQYKLYNFFFADCLN